MASQMAFDLFEVEEDRATILVVDDSVSGAKLLEIQLAHAGYHVILAHDGHQALSRAREDLPDLIILDVMMPGMDGFSVCQRLKAEEETWLIPVVLLTALNRVQDRIKGLQAGADDFLSKPFNREELLARVRSLLRLRAAYNALQTERNHLALLNTISQEINSSLSSDTVLPKIVIRTREALSAAMCSIVILGEGSEETRQIISRESQPVGVAEIVTPAIMREGLAGWVLNQREGTVIDDASQDDRWLVLPGDTEPVGSAIAAPLEVGQEIIGILLLTHSAPGFFHEDHLGVLTSIATQAAITVRNARLYEKEQQQRKELELLQVAGVAISAELNRDALRRLIVRQGAALVKASAASLMLLDESGEILTPQAWQGLSDRYALRERLSWDVLSSLLPEGSRSFQIEDLAQQPLGRSDLAQREGLVSLLSLSLVASGEFMGLLNLYSRGEARRFGSREIQVAETFVQQAAIALENAELLARTREERGKLSAVLNSTTDAVLVVDEAGNLILANPAAMETFGLNGADLVGQPLASRAPSQLLAVFHEVAVSGQPGSGEFSIADGRILYVSVAPVTGVGQVAVVQDITPLKELEAMRLDGEQEERRQLRQVFERYVAPGLVDRILAQEAGVFQRRERREVVVLFTDLRGFTRMTATFPAHTVIEVLNEFFTAIVEVVYTHQGTVFDLAGDEVMVGFGAPFDQENAVARALNTARDMQRVFASLRQRWIDQQGIEVGLGVGIDVGPVVMGSIGAPSQMNFGLVGDAVNTAHGLVELAQHGEVVVTEAVMESMGGELEGWTVEKPRPVYIKGKSLPVEIYRARPQMQGPEAEV